MKEELKLLAEEVREEEGWEKDATIVVSCVPKYKLGLVEDALNKLGVFKNIEVIPSNEKRVLFKQTSFPKKTDGRY